jgi:hypothetical protein
MRFIRFTATLSLSLVLSFSVASCGSGSSTEIGLGDLAAEMARAYCMKAYQCCNSDEIAQMEDAHTFSGESGCRTFYSGSFEQLVTLMRNAVADGRASYDAVKAKGCVDAYQSLGCAGTNDPQSFFDSCEVPYQGLQNTGDDCVNILECASGNYCSTNTKTCSAYLIENNRCGGSREPYCGADLYCDTDICVPLKAENSDCSVSSECAYGLACDETSHLCTTPDPVCTGN